ncbi:MAG: ribosome biogenesis GTPase Der [Patescibacteria group bacterium]
MGKRIPKVVLVGRINAGKSTLFNTLSDATRAIVSSTPGTTRDLNYATIEWRGTTFELIDTGGLDAARLGEIERYVQDHAYRAISRADLALFVIDGRTELTGKDRTIARTLKQNSNLKKLVVLNKLDSPELRRQASPDFSKLGLGPLFYVSAVSGIGTGDLLDAVVAELPRRKVMEKPTDIILSIIGKTNVGKSSLLNAILGQERVLVTPIPHTTREPNDIPFTYRGSNFKLVDTAGMRKKRGKADPLERESVERTLHAIKRSAISLLVTDVSEPLSSQDQAIAEIALRERNSIIIIANKWDLAEEKTEEAMRSIRKSYGRYFPSLGWAPLEFVSALKKIRVGKLLQKAIEVVRERNKIVPQETLDAILAATPLKVGKPAKGKKNATLLSLQQAETAPPTFTLTVKRPDRINPAYLNLLEKRIRSQVGFTGTPITMLLQKRR